MFGNNQRLAPQKGEGDKLHVHSTFVTIQGEGPFQGTPAVFLRLYGCNLACWFCDTDFESQQAEHLTTALVDSILELIRGSRAFRHHDHPLVVITGGEPLRQPIGPLCQRLLDAGCTVQVETSGSLYTPLPFCQNMHVVCSPKTPAINPYLVPHITAYKYVVRHDDASPDDGLPLSYPHLGKAETKGAHGKARKPLARPAGSLYTPVWVTPCDEQDKETNELNLQHATNIALRYGYRLGVQLHKLVGLP